MTTTTSTTPGGDPMGTMRGDHDDDAAEVRPELHAVPDLGGTTILEADPLPVEVAEMLSARPVLEVEPGTEADAVILGATAAVADGVGEVFTVVDGQAVDSGYFTDTPIADRPIVAEWLRSRTSFVEVAREWLLRRFHVVGYHLARIPLYWLRLTMQGAGPGLRRAVRQSRCWASDPTFEDSRQVMLATGKGDINELKADHDAKVRGRTIKVGIGWVGVLAVLAVLVFRSDWFTLAAVTIGAANVLGVYGRPDATKPIIERVRYNKHTAPPFTEGLMLEALREVGAGKTRRGIHVIQPPAKIRTGWEAIVSLDIPASKVIAETDKFATAIDRPGNCVWLTGDPDESAGWLRIIITRKSLRQANMPDWPFLNGGSYNYFTDGVPVGIDAQGNPVTARKAYVSTVYGGIMGAGKTVSMINAVLGQAVDPRVELHVNDLKGGTDWLDFGPIAHFLRAGTSTEDFLAVLADLTELNKRMDRRFETLRRLRDEGIVSPKTTDALANRKELDLHPIVVVIDETQEMFEFAADAKQYEELVSRLVKKGRAVAITVEGGTQEVKKATLPIAGLCHWRHCLAVQGHGAVDLVLGTGAYNAGFNADALTSADVGIGYFGSGKEIGLVRSYFIDPDSGDIAKVVERLQTERAAAGRLTGMAAGDDTEATQADTVTVVDHLAAVWPADGGPKGGPPIKLSYVALADILAGHLPDIYTGLSSDKLSQLTNGHRLPSANNCKGPDGKWTLKGLAIADIRETLDIRDSEAGNGAAQ